MKNQIELPSFWAATISTGTYGTKEYWSKEYSTKATLTKGLRANGFKDTYTCNGLTWNAGGKQFKLTFQF